MPEAAFGAEEFAAATGVSRETLARLKAYADLLADWNARHNLVSPRAPWPISGGGISGIRAQLAPLVPETARTLADLGSGAGFPGLVLAATAAGTGSRSPCTKPRPRNAPSWPPPPSAMDLPVAIENARMEDAARPAL